jgi:hypothetical protein
MLSAATVALLTGQAFADTTITKATTVPLTTGTLPSGAKGTGSAGNIIVNTGGSIAADNTGAGAITVNSNNYVYNDALISNKGATTTTGVASSTTTTTTTTTTSTSNIGASGIRIDMTTNPNVSGLSFNNSASTSITGSGIYLDAASALDLSGSGTGKHGIWLNGTGTYTGDITSVQGSSINVVGDQGQGITVDSGAILAGNLNLGGSMSVSQTTNLSTTASSIYGLYMGGQVNGNIDVPAGGSISVTGEGSQAMFISGTGVGGNITIGGTLSAAGYSTTATNTTAKINNANTIYPEAGTTFTVAANVNNGIALLGPAYSGDTTTASSVTSIGFGPAIRIDPSPTDATVAQTTPLIIGVYTTNGTTYADANDPGFSFYNRGSVSTSPANANNSVAGILITGSQAYPTILTGGIFNSGTLSVQTSTDLLTASSVNATALSIEGFTTLQTAAYNTTTDLWTDTGTGLTGKNGNDQAVLVNSNLSGSGSITASVSGPQGGIATAVNIASTSNVSSIINTGTISASNTITPLASNPINLTLTYGRSSTGAITGNPVFAFGIVDASGTLTSIYNTGTISAQATVLDNNTQVAEAINLAAGTPSSPSGSGVTITDKSIGTKAATISGDILFGSGNNQIINIAGNGASAIASITGNITYGLLGTGSTSGDQLNIGNYAQVSGVVIAPDGVSVDIKSHGLLNLQSLLTTTVQTTAELDAVDFHVENGGNISLGVSESVAANGAMVLASHSVELDAGSNLGVGYASFVPQGTNPFVLFSAPHGNLNIDPTTIATYNLSLTKNVVASNGQNGSLPFLFASANLATTSSASVDQLVLTVVPKTLGTGANQLNLTPGSYANTPLATSGGGTTTLFALANAALSQDDTLGAAMVNGIIDTKSAQAAYNAFAPNVTGGSRAIAISITDQATGVVGAHQRALRLYGRDSGDETLWGEEFVQMIKDPGRGATDPNTIGSANAKGYKLQPGFKDHGFGFVLGMDAGSPKYGWYGGSFTFYGGDVGELARNSHTNQQWYILTGYTAWRGRGLFFDSKIDVGYSHIDGKRYIDLSIPQNTSPQTYSTYVREADNKHPATMLSGGFSTGGVWTYGATTIMPQVSVDGLVMREEGYTETQPTTSATTIGDAFDLTVQPYYAQSLRVFLGTTVRYDINLWDIYLQPEARAGYRYDLFSDPVKLKAAFAHSGVGGTTGTQFTMLGPDPSQGNFVLGGSLAGTTDTWTMSFNFDLVRGSNGAFEQVGTINLLGRI